MTRSYSKAIAAALAFAGVSVAAATTCAGYCPMPPPPPTPTFTVGLQGGGHVLGANAAQAGTGGTVALTSNTQEFLRIELNLTGTGGPSGLCPGGCPANNLTAVLAGGVLTNGHALHTVAGNGGNNPTTANTNSGSSAAVNLFSQGTWSAIPTYTGLPTTSAVPTAAPR